MTSRKLTTTMRNIRQSPIIYNMQIVFSYFITSQKYVIKVTKKKTKEEGRTGKMRIRLLIMISKAKM